jgi:hypothetical protein
MAHPRAGPRARAALGPASAVDRRGHGARSTYTVADAVKDYLAEIKAEKKPTAVKGAEYVFDAWILPELGAIQVEKLTTERINPMAQ